MYNKRFTIAAYSIPPFLYLNEDLLVSGGIAHEGVRVLAGHLGFEYEYLVASNWFDFRPDGSVGGSLGHVSYYADDTFMNGTLYRYTLLRFCMEGQILPLTRVPSGRARCLT